MNDNETEVCSAEGCGHPAADHVNDRVMHEGRWETAQRCVTCERTGGPCTDAMHIFEEAALSQGDEP